MKKKKTDKNPRASRINDAAMYPRDRRFSFRLDIINNAHLTSLRAYKNPGSSYRIYRC